MTNEQFNEMCNTHIRSVKKAVKSTEYVHEQLFNDFSPSVMSVFSSMSNEQKTLLYTLVGKALNEAEKRLNIKKVISNGPATIAIWDDETKTVVKLMEGDTNDTEKALMMCIMERLLGGSKMEVKRFFKKWIPEDNHN